MSQQKQWNWGFKVACEPGMNAWDVMVLGAISQSNSVQYVRQRAWQHASRHAVSSDNGSTATHRTPNDVVPG